MRFLRTVVLIVAGVLIALWVLRGAVFVTMLPYLTWQMFHEGGYPVWGQVLGVAAVTTVLAYLVYRIIDQRGRRW
jgi:membrane protein implicated in regulation of membrane protease activity